jgi:hypothetical protein
MLEGGATHVGVATDHVIESFRNDLWAATRRAKASTAHLWAQFHPLEDALAAMGVVVWAMVELEADDALASAARSAAKTTASRKSASGRRTKTWRSASSAIGSSRWTGEAVRSATPRPCTRNSACPRTHPGLSSPSWATRRTATRECRGSAPRRRARLIERYGPLEDFPVDGSLDRDRALLFKRLATLGCDAPLFKTSTSCCWRGPTPAFPAVRRKDRRPEAPARVAALTPQASDRALVGVILRTEGPRDGCAGG